jgi:hypothetical protein
VSSTIAACAAVKSLQTIKLRAAPVRPRLRNGKREKAGGYAPPAVFLF